MMQQRLGTMMAVALAGLLSGPAAGQQMSEEARWHLQQQQAGLAPVDQLVQDVDPLGTSLRQSQPGIGQFDDRHRVYENPQAEHWRTPGGPGYDPQMGMHLPQQYQFRTPGVRAWFDRPEYLAQTGTGRRDFGRNVAPERDGGFIEMVPAGTVFDLIPRQEQAISPLLQMSPYSEEDLTRMRREHRVDTRVGGRVEAVDGRSFEATTRVDTTVRESVEDEGDYAEYDQQIRDPFRLEH